MRNTMLAAIILVVCLSSMWLSAAAQSDAAISGQLIIFHAGSLAVPFSEIADAFMKEYPEVTVLREVAGSRTCARKIADLNKRCDVFASADYTIIDDLLIPEYAEWNIKFATNEMSITFHEKSRRAEEITVDNWHEVLLDGDVRFGRSDPHSDPCGYRAVLTMKLAERYYDEEGLADKLLVKDREYIRPKEVDLIALLELGEIDYIFLYRSVAEQHGLRRIVLPDAVNLKNPDFAGIYKTASVDISGKAPGTTITKVGRPMVYGVTIPATVENRKTALAFVTFLLDEDRGGAIMARNGQPSAVPSGTATFDKLPSALRKFARRDEQPSDTEK